MTEHFPLVIITWEDHTSIDAWQDSDEAKKTAKAKIINSVGWLHHETDKGYSLVSAVCVDDGDVGCQQFILKSATVGTINVPPHKKRRRKA